MNLPLQMSAVYLHALAQMPKVDPFGRVLPAKSHTVTGCTATECVCAGNATDFACCTAGEFCTCAYPSPGSNSPPLPGCSKTG
jgi:hypothetical protein